MEIGGVGAGKTHPETDIFSISAIATPISSVTAGLQADTVATLLQQMASAPLAQLIAEIRSTLPAADPTVVSEILGAAESAALDGDIPRALAAITDFVKRSPEQMDTLAAEFSLAPIRAQIQDHLLRLTAAVKVEADVRLSSALVYVSKPGDLNTREVLQLAQHLIDSGRHANILLATDLSQAVMNYYGPFSIPSTQAMSAGVPRLCRSGPEAEIPSPRAPWGGATAFIYGGVTESLKQMWRRSPLLLLFFVWIAIGFISALATLGEIWSLEISLEVWGAGSAGLIGVGTYHRLRGRGRDGSG